MKGIKNLKAICHEIYVDITKLSWVTVFKTLARRIKADRLPLTASSLTFTSLIAIVPLFTLILAILSAIPSASWLQNGLQQSLKNSLLPENISTIVFTYLTRFSGKAIKLGSVGLMTFMFTALAVIFTLERTFNNIWRVGRSRSAAQRIAVYWTILTLGPLLLAVSASVSTSTLSLSRGFMRGDASWLVEFAQSILDAGLIAVCLGIAFKILPNTYVKWSHAWIAAIFAAIATGIAKKLLVVYLYYVPAYSKIYGAFSVIPILLIWIYVAWLIVLLGAVLCAHLPTMIEGGKKRFQKVRGWQFLIALSILKMLDEAKRTDKKGLTQAYLVQQLSISAFDMSHVMNALCELDWIAQISGPTNKTDSPRFVLLIDIKQTLPAPLLHRLLLAESPLTALLLQLDVLDLASPAPPASVPVTLEKLILANQITIHERAVG